MPRFPVRPGRAQKPAHVDRAVLVKAPVFHRDKGGGQIGRHLVQRQPLADNGTALPHLVAFHIQKGEGDRPVQRIKVARQVERRRHPA